MAPNVIGKNISWAPYVTDIQQISHWSFSSLHQIELLTFAVTLFGCWRSWNIFKSTPLGFRYLPAERHHALIYLTLQIQCPCTLCILLGPHSTFELNVQINCCSWIKYGIGILKVYGSIITYNEAKDEKVCFANSSVMLHRLTQNVASSNVHSYAPMCKPSASHVESSVQHL